MNKNRDESHCARAARQIMFALFCAKCGTGFFSIESRAAYCGKCMRVETRRAVHDPGGILDRWRARHDMHADD